MAILTSIDPSGFKPVGRKRENDPSTCRKQVISTPEFQADVLRIRTSSWQYCMCEESGGSEGWREIRTLGVLSLALCHAFTFAHRRPLGNRFYLCRLRCQDPPPPSLAGVRRRQSQVLPPEERGPTSCWTAEPASPGCWRGTGLGGLPISTARRPGSLGVRGLKELCHRALGQEEGRLGFRLPEL